MLSMKEAMEEDNTMINTVPTIHVPTITTADYDEIYMLSNCLNKYLKSNKPSTLPTPQTILQPTPEPEDEPKPSTDATFPPN
eukprot:3680827-Ditylum_brightwellii.AAC.1